MGAEQRRRYGGRGETERVQKHVRTAFAIRAEHRGPAAVARGLDKTESKQDRVVKVRRGSRPGGRLITPTPLCASRLAESLLDVEGYQRGKNGAGQLKLCMSVFVLRWGGGFVEGAAVLRLRTPRATLSPERLPLQQNSNSPADTYYKPSHSRTSQHTLRMSPSGFHLW